MAAVAHWAAEARMASALGWEGYDSSLYLLAAVVATRAGEVDAGRMYLQRVAQNRPAWAHLQTARFHRFSGYLAAEVGEDDLSIGHYRRAVSLARSYGDHQSLAIELLGLAGALAEQGYFRESLSLLDQIKPKIPSSSPIHGQVLSNSAENRARAFLSGFVDARPQRIRDEFRQAWTHYQTSGASHPRLTWVAHRAAAFELALGAYDKAAVWLSKLSATEGLELGPDRVVREVLQAQIASARPELDSYERLVELEARLSEQEGAISEPRIAIALLRGEVAHQQGKLTKAVVDLRRGLSLVGRRAHELSAPTTLWALLLRHEGAVGLLADALIALGRRDEAVEAVEAYFAQQHARVVAAGSVDRGSPQWREFILKRARLRQAEEQWCLGLDDAEKKACYADRLAARDDLKEARRQLYARASRTPDVPQDLPKARRTLGTAERIVYGVSRGRTGRQDRLLLLWVGKSAVDVKIDSVASDKQLRRVYAIGRVDPAALAPTLSDLEWTRLPSASMLWRRTPRVSGAPLLVLDPDGTLPQVRRPTRALYRGKEIDTLAGPQATHDAVSSALGRAAQFHFVGHGFASGSNALSTYLGLHKGELSWEDVLQLARSPRVVILQGCETGGVEGPSGIPQAFVDKGAWAVLATNRDLAAGEGHAFVSRFIEAGGLDEPGRAWRRAVGKSRRSGDDSYLAFDLWGPLEPLSNEPE